MRWFESRPPRREPEPNRDGKPDVERRRRDGGDSTTGVAAECEAFLYGCLAEYLAARGAALPGWVRINRLAHATEDELLELVSNNERRGRDAEWSAATAFLAGELLDVSVRTGQPVADLQAELLVPLELRLIEHPSARVLRPAQLVSLVMAELHGRANNWA